MDEYTSAVNETVEYLSGRLPWVPDCCLVLGTGLGGLAKALREVWTAPYSEIPHFPISTAPEHAGRLRVGHLGRSRVALFQGRCHYYEGYSQRDLTLPIRVMGRLGVHTLIACSAAGGLNLTFTPGDLMVITDHINLISDNPLRGPNNEQWGPRFPDLASAYTPALRVRLLRVAGAMGLTLRQGVFVAVPGPSLETPAETRFLRLIGADAVAMSLVPEVLVAVHSGMRVLGISVVANVNDPDNFQPILIEDVIARAKDAEEVLSRLLAAFLEEPISA